MLLCLPDSDAYIIRPLQTISSPAYYGKFGWLPVNLSHHRSGKKVDGTISSAVERPNQAGMPAGGVAQSGCLAYRCAATLPQSMAPVQPPVVLLTLSGG